MKHFLIALQFLTIFPIEISAPGKKLQIEKKDFGRSLLYFPVVGALIGLLLIVIAFVFGFLPTLVRGAFILIASIIITGGIHLDGLADTCDGFYGSKSKEKTLRIMRDSRIGVMGAIGIACLLLLKFTLIVSLAPNVLYRALIIMAVFGRWSMVLACFSSNYAREAGGAKYFVEYDSKKEFLAGTLFVIALFLLLMGLKGIVLLAISVILVFLFINYVKKRIGGVTGDTIGATCELAEIIILFFALVC